METKETNHKYIKCICCGKSLSRPSNPTVRRKHLLAEGSGERKIVEMQYFPKGEVPIEAWVCHNCWRRASRHAKSLPKLVQSSPLRPVIGDPLNTPTQSMTEQRECKNEPAELQELFGDIHPDQELAAFGQPSAEIEILVKCAICLSPKANIDITELKTKEKSYKDIFSFCLDLEVTEKLETHKLCVDCYNNLLSFDEFKTLALKNLAYLRAASPDNYYPLDDGKNDHIGDETNNEIEIKTEDDIKEDDLRECTLDNKAECPEEYLHEECLEETCLYTDIEAVPEVILEKLVSEDQLGGELTVAAAGEDEEGGNHISELDRPTDICRKCGRCVWDITGHLLTHIPKSTKKRRFVCDYCDKEYATKKGLRRHIEPVHMLIPRQRPICNICNKVVVNLKTHHLATHIKDSMKCSSCHKWFATKESLRLHKFSSCHQKEKKKCRLCGIAVWNMKEHLRTHLPESERPRVKCYICSKDYSCKTSLQIHVKNVHSGNTQSTLETCDICLKEFRDLENHKLRQHFKERLPFKCTKCPKRFLSVPALREHTRLQCGLLKYDCDICHIECSTPSGLWQHKRRVHEKIADCLCQFCSKTFFNKPALRRHLRSHTNERPYKCEICGKSFNWQRSLKNHRKIHNRERNFECDICKKKYWNKSYLVRHILSHTMPKTHPCQYCGRMFKRTDQRRAHEINIHEKRGEISLANC